MTGVLKSEEGAIHLHPKRMENPRLQRLKQRKKQNKNNEKHKTKIAKNRK
jgi:hypothetical protein